MACWRKTVLKLPPSGASARASAKRSLGRGPPTSALHLCHPCGRGPPTSACLKPSTSVHLCYVVTPEPSLTAGYPDLPCRYDVSIPLPLMYDLVDEMRARLQGTANVIGYAPLPGT
eukprot:1186073-Prorocentrum_minimum.AAC.2